MFQFHCKESKTGMLWAMHAPSSLGVITSNVVLMLLNILPGVMLQFGDLAYQYIIYAICCFL